MVFLIAICRQLGDKWQSKAQFLTIFITFVNIINIFDCRPSVVYTVCHKIGVNTVMKITYLNFPEKIIYLHVAEFT